MATIFDNIKITTEGGKATLNSIQKVIEELASYSNFNIKRKKNTIEASELGFIFDSDEAAELAERVARATNGVDFVIEANTSTNLSIESMSFLIECKNGKLTMRSSDWYILFTSDMVEDYETYEEYLEEYDELSNEDDFMKVKENEETYLVNNKIYVELPLGEAIVLEY